MTVTTEIEQLPKTVTEQDSKRERVFKGIYHPFEPFAQAALLRERVVRCFVKLPAVGLLEFRSVSG